LYVEN
jgi:hypothetical protein